MKRRFLLQSQRLTILQIIGASILILGVVALIGIVMYDFTEPKSSNENNVAAVGVFLIMMGIALLFPDMLKGNDKETTSAMRVAVFMVVSIFSILAVKVFWGCKPEEFSLNPNWAWLVGAALGSKAVQSLGENGVFGRGQTGATKKPGINDLFLGNAQDDLPLHDNSKITTAPNTRPSNLSPLKP